MLGLERFRICTWQNSQIRKMPLLKPARPKVGALAIQLQKILQRGHPLLAHAASEQGGK